MKEERTEKNEISQKSVVLIQINDCAFWNRLVVSNSLSKRLVVSEVVQFVSGYLVGISVLLMD